MTDLSDFKLEIVAAKVNLFAEAPDNQCCGSGMFIPDHGSSFYLSRIQHNNKRGGKICYLTLFGSHKISQICKLSYFWIGKEKKLTIFLPKIVTKLSEIHDGDPGSEKNLS